MRGRGRAGRAGSRSSSRPTLESLEDRCVLSLLGQQLFPSDNPWNQRVSAAPVAANSTAVIQSIIANQGSNGRIHPDFNTLTDTPITLYGSPYNIVRGNTQPKVRVVIDAYARESDLVDAPIPIDAVIQGDLQTGPSATVAERGDSHLIVWDVDNNIVYEFYHATRPSENADGQWHADAQAVWDLKENTFRPLGWTSANAAGTAILPGLVRPDEALPVSKGGQGVIDHAISVTLRNPMILSQYIYPASHTANPGNWNPAVQVPMGTRLRLKADVDIARLQPESRVIAQAMKEYGLIVNDNGANFFLAGAGYSVDADNQRTLTWDHDDLFDWNNGLKSLRFADFEVVDLRPIVTGLSSASGEVGSTVIVTGQNFSGAAGQIHVFFGDQPGTGVTVLDDSRVQVTVPANQGTVPVTVRSGRTVAPSVYNATSPVFGYGVSNTSADFTYETAPPPPPPPLGTTASFLGVDATTRGDWAVAHGGDGHAIPGVPAVWPGYASVSMAGAMSHTWAASTSDTRAPTRTATGPDRVASCWYTAAARTPGRSFTIDVNLTDGRAHKVSLYALDWDGGGARGERVDVIDAASGVVLDSRGLSNFEGGKYLSWTLSGHVQLRVVHTGKINAVVSGLFFGEAAAAAATPRAAVAAARPAIRGGVVNAYGDVYAIPGVASSRTRDDDNTPKRPDRVRLDLDRVRSGRVLGVVYGD